MPTTHLTYFLIGGGIGLLSAVIGAAVDYLLARRRDDRGEVARLPGCLMLTAGGLGGLGLFFTVVSWLLTDSLLPTLMTGLGVFSGFFAGFAALFIGSVLFSTYGK